MLYHDITDEGTDVNKTSESKECDVCHYWYFLDKWFKFQTDVCNGCHDILMISMNLSDIVFLKVFGVNYSCIISRISKSEAVNLLQNIDSSDKSGTL